LTRGVVARIRCTTDGDTIGRRPALRDTVGVDAPPLDRYEQIALNDGILIYDTDEETAWLQSDVVVELGARA